MSVKDHKGNEFNNKIDMCDSYGIDFHLYQRRLERKWSVQRALETPKADWCIIYDHLRNKFSSEQEMADAWGLMYSCFSQRLTRGWNKNGKEKGWL